jgi:hypothetical protein
METNQPYPKYEVNHKVMRDWNDALFYWMVYGGVLMEKLDVMTPWHVLRSTEGDLT